MNRNRLMFAIFLLGVLLLITLPVQEDGGIQTTLTANQETITVGDPVELTLKVTHPTNQQVIIPKLERNWGDFEVQDQSSAKTIINENGTATTRQNITISLFQPGVFETPPLSLIISGDNGQTSELAAQPVTVSVASVLAEGDTELKDIRPQVSMDVPLPWSLLVAGLVAVAALIGSSPGFIRPWPRKGGPVSVSELMW